MSAAKGPRILLVVGGGIAAYKSCELVRLIRKGAGGVAGDVTCVVTKGGQQFVTPMALAALSENPVHTTLWDLKNEAEMGHIQLSREADLVVVCPATADLLAKMATGIADDLATTLILATDKPVMAVPAMNVRMWQHEATQRNVAWLRQAGVTVIEPDVGPMACGEFGPGRMPEPEAIWAQIAEKLGLEHDYSPQAEVWVEEEGDETDEALEPEPDIEKRGGGLGGLFASLIPRSTPKRSAREIEEVWAAAPEPLDEVSDTPEDTGENVPAAPIAKPGFAGSVLATKGKASSAPPTDPQAMNHMVKSGDADFSPEPLAPTEMPVAVDPLYGQPDFDTDPQHRPLFGKHVLVTAGPTHEPIDPVRYIANRSSGRQGFAIAAAAANAGARVTLVAGPVALETPPGVERFDVQSAEEMAAEVKRLLPADAAVMVAAVSDWRTKDFAQQKMKKRGSAPPALILTENTDILAAVAGGTERPRLLIGFAAETEDVVENAKTKRKRKGVDWIVANDVSGPVGTGVMGGDNNQVYIVTGEGVEALEEMPKQDVARVLVERIAQALSDDAHG
ncbi:bifunctional phosphopantothenoylcysteine decarboxylase/phosphopantothenate synthase [Allopontixanthobacter sp.]|uniref:bifunctional phosphopantothenoylcysteine decarboxylase/phosphopantothenate synthase n=1 Tax=Allopontixanthobacter sp. TaxID=2906452 RepID=UPI002ABB493C|nr:bifunctional phosphopantothenoylcysteine decarboxylase/phosphopantothenate synthase [Allopontixanthobacter sp.]MDZ4307696.1 bifunctional phosphopantothenoylcysteine decarboxylase/phosphopantothenate synthase [Allopontixanthobacter sp.]